MSDRCLVIWSLGPGGSERVLTTIANEWCRRGLDVSVVTLAPPGTDHYRLQDGVRRVSLNIDERFVRRPSLIANAQILYRLRRVLQRIGPRTIVSFIEGTNSRVLLGTRGLPAAVIVSERTDPRHHRVSETEAWLRKLTYPWADAVVVQTEAVREWAETITRSELVHVVANPVRPCQPPAGKSRRASIASVGRLVPSKGHDVLIAAFAAIAPKYPEWNLEIVGEGPQRGTLERLITQFGLNHRIHLLGLLRDPRTILRSAGLFVLASRYEGFPNALLEAMSCGVPVIATDCPSGPREIVTNGDTGFLVPVDDVDEMARTIGRLISDPDLRQRTAKRAQRDSSEFRIPVVLDAWESVIRSAHAQRHGRVQ